MQTYAVEVEFQPDPEKEFWKPGSIKQRYTFTREQLDGIADAYNDYLYSSPQRLAIEDVNKREPIPIGSMAYIGTGLLPGARVNCSQNEDVPLILSNHVSMFVLKQLKRYILYATSPKPRFYPEPPNCAYTFDTDAYLQGFFWVFQLFGQDVYSLNLRLYDRDTHQYIPVPYPT